MCPVCITTAVMVAGAGSTAGFLALCTARFGKFFKANRFGPFRKRLEDLRWQQAKRETGNTGMGISR
jgi:hypothetical protein